MKIEKIIESLNRELELAQQAKEPEEWGVLVPKSVLRCLIEFYEKEYWEVQRVEDLVSKGTIAIREADHAEFKRIVAIIKEDLGVPM